MNDIVVLGYGTWSDVNALPTLGYGLGAAAVIVDGPYCADEGFLFVPESEEGVVYVPDSEEGQIVCE